MKPFEKVLDALKVERRNGTAAEAHCPAHEDNQASLSVTEKKSGKVLLNCHAGCDTADVVRAAGLQWDDLFPQKHKRNGRKEKREIVDRYTYTDAAGETLFQVVRFDPKGFAQYVPGKGWGRKKHGVEATLYRLPKVKEAAQESDAVFIVEGEKDVHTLEGMDLVATTCPQGTGEWKGRYSKHLKGAHVVLLPDNDPPGRKHAEEVARSVWDAAKSVRIVELEDVPPKGDVTDWVERGHTAEELKELVRDTASLDKAPAEPQSSQNADTAPKAFWRVDKNGEVSINRFKLVAYLVSEGYGKIYDQDDLESSLVRVQNQAAERTSTERIKDHVLTYVRKHAGANVVEKLMRGGRVYFSQSLLEFFPVLDLTFKRDTKEAAFFYYRNGFVRVTAEGFELRPYSELDGVIWKDQIIDRDFTPMNGSADVLQSEWHRFLCNVTGGEDQRMNALASAIGYLLHEWRNPAESKAIVFMDEKDSDVANGRTGKSVVAKSLRHLVPTVRIDARNFSFESRFRFQQVQLDTRVVDFNDASKKFDFDRMFSVITDDWDVERKGQHAFTIPFEEAPKVVISTNFVIEGQGASFEDRIFQVEFAPHYTTDHKPVDEFGHLLFSGWNAKEWAAFDNLMMGFARSYLADGLVPYEHVNLSVRRLKQQTCPDFAEWITDFIELGRAYVKDALWGTFKEEYAPDYDDLTKRKFDYWCRSYARIYDLEIDRPRRRVDGVRTKHMKFKPKSNA